MTRWSERAAERLGAPLVIAVVEDDASLRTAFSQALRGANAVVHEFGSTDGVLARHDLAPFDLIILDIVLPGRDGVKLVEEIRASGASVPILMVSALNDDANVIRALEAGAAEYILKPLSVPALLARVRALTRRGLIAPTAESSSVRLDSERRTVIGPCGEVPLTVKEYALLRCLLLRPRQLVARETLLREVWGYDFDPKTSILDVTIHRLRAKLERATDGLEIEALRGAGYRVRRRTDDATS